MATVTATFTPAAAAYSAGDIIEGAKEFKYVGSPGALIRALATRLMVKHTDVISGETSYRLHLYNVTPPSALADNAAWDLPAGDRDSYLGYLDLGTPVDVGASLYVQTDGLTWDRVLATTSLWGYLVTNGGFTATAAGRVVKLTVAQIEQ